MATNPATFSDTTRNDPVHALADIWAELAKIDQAQVELHHRERGTHERKDALEEAVLALEPQTIGDVLSLILVASDAFHPKEGQEHIERALHVAIAWLADHAGATTPLLHLYFPRKFSERYAKGRKEPDCSIS